MDEDFVRQLKSRLAAEAAREAPPDGFPRLPDIPARRYTDSAFFELEQASVFRQSWLFAGHLDQRLGARTSRPGFYGAMSAVFLARLAHVTPDTNHPPERDIIYR